MRVQIHKPRSYPQAFGIDHIKAGFSRYGGFDRSDLLTENSDVRHLAIATRWIADFAVLYEEVVAALRLRSSQPRQSGATERA